MNMVSLFVLFSFCNNLCGQLSEPAASEIQKMQQQLHSDTAEERLKAVIFWNQYADLKTVRQVLPMLRKMVQHENDAKVRQFTVESLGMISFKQKLPCPTELIEAIHDREEFVRYQAHASLLMFPELPDAGFPIIAKGIQSKDLGIICDCLYLLGRYYPRNAQSKTLVAEAKKYPHLEVRHSARYAEFRMTDDLTVYLKYLVQMREQPETVLTSGVSEEQRTKERQSRNLFNIGSAISLIKWSNDSPEKLGKALLRLIDDADSNIRLGAVRNIELTAQKREVPRNNPLDELLKPMELISPEKKKGPEKSAVLRYLEEKNIIEKLDIIARTDREEEIRELAKKAIRTIQQLPN
ncbi:MAG: hypothetical protein R3B84_10185 [Zavarzinella sp.]